MRSIWGWIKAHPEFLFLIAIVIVGQVLEKVLHPSVEQPYVSAEFPIVPAIVLGVMAVLAAVVVWLRLRLGSQLMSAGGRLSLPEPASLPARYKVANPPRQAIGGSLAVLDIALVLLIAATLRAPALALAGRYVPPTWAEVGFVVLVLLAALLLIVKLFRNGGPVLVLLLWSGLDRVVPTAGFLSTSPMAVPTRPRTVTVTPVPTPAPEPTVVAPQAAAAEPEPTVVTQQPAAAELEPTVVAQEKSGGELEPTVVAQEKSGGEGDSTVVAEATVVSVRKTVSDEPG